MMNKYSKLATLSVAVFVGLLVAYLGGYQAAKTTDSSTVSAAKVAPKPETPALAQNTQPQSSGEQSATEVAAIDPEDVDPADIDWASILNRGLPGLDQMLLRANIEVDYSEAEIAAFNKLHVIEFNPTVDSVCNEEIAEHTTTGFITICHGIKAYPDHPYEGVEVDELIELAEADAAAAVFVSRKAETIKERIGFALRAAALSGKSGPVLATAAKELITPDSQYGGETHGRASDQTVPATVITRLILESVAQKMGDPRANPEAWQKYIDDFAKTEEERNDILDSIQAATRVAMEGMAEIQQQVTGSTQIRELLDA